MVPIPVTVAGALASAAYLNARFSLAHDLLFFRIFGSTLFNLFRTGLAGRINVFYVLETQALDKATGAKPFILFEGRSVSYAKAYETVLRYGAWLREYRGVREGDVVALDYQNSDTFVFLWFALWAIGAKPAFINYHLQGAALSHCLRASTAKLALVDPRVAESVSEDVRGEVSGMEFVVFAPELEAEAQKQEPVRYPDAVRTEKEPTDMAMLIYTSGTTGMPKPAIMSWAKVYVAANMSAKGTCSKSSDVFYTVRFNAQDWHFNRWHLITTSSVCPFTTAPALVSQWAARCFWEPPRPSGVASPLRPFGRRCGIQSRPSSSMWGKRVGILQ